MSTAGDIKRVSLTTISTSVVSSSGTSNNAVLPAKPDFSSRFGEGTEPEPATAVAHGDSKCLKPTVRIDLPLFQTDNAKYPEFNFSKLRHGEKKKAKKLEKQRNGSTTLNDDPFADNDEDVARIAKQMEKKYGNAYAQGRGRNKKDDFCDIGMGYDESDSFIDNTEAYDEVLPEDVETVEGGFYINCGALVFKNPNKRLGTTRTDQIIKMPERSRKRVLSSSSEGDDDDEQDDNDNESDDDDDDEEDDSESDSIEEDDQDVAMDKKKYKHGEKRSKSGLATSSQKSSSPHLSIKKPAKKLAVTSSSSNSPRPNNMETSDTEERQAQALKKVVKTTTVKDMLKAKRDSFLKSQGDNAVKGVINGEVKCTSTDVESSSENGGTDSATEHGVKADKPNKNGSENMRTTDTLLPTTLDPEVLASINSFKDIVKSRDMCGKKFFFDDKLSALLLKLYEAVQRTDRSIRNTVCAHIEYQLQLPKYFILRKAQALRSKEEKHKTTVALDKLRKAIVDIMPKTIANYEMELHRFAELQTADVNAEHPPEMPRKKFQWNNELREMLHDVYHARWTSYHVLGKRKDSLEEFINGYLKEKVVELWPNGWMRYEELQFEIDKHRTIKKSKEKSKKSSSNAMATKTIVNATAVPALMDPAAIASNFIKHFEEFSTQNNSRATSDTDSATSASSNSLKRKIKDSQSSTALPNASLGEKPAKKKSQKQYTQQPQQQQLQQQQLQQQQLQQQQLQQQQLQQQQTVMQHLDQLQSLPSTSAQAAAFNAAIGALDLVSPAKKPDHGIFHIMTQAQQATATISSIAMTMNSQLSPLHSKLVNSTRPMPHVINLDDYKSPNDILQTSKQLAAANYPPNSPVQGFQWSPTGQPVANVVTAATATTTTTTSVAFSGRCESSSESDGVEIVGVYQQAKPTAARKPKNNQKNKTVFPKAAMTPSLPPQNGPNGTALGFAADNTYAYNKKNLLGAPGLPANAGAQVFDLTKGGQNFQKYSEKMLGKQIDWQMAYAAVPGNNNSKGTPQGAPTHQ